MLEYPGVPDEQPLTLMTVLPVFNEFSNIESEVSRIRASLEAEAISYEIIAVDDGSTDGSGELSRASNEFVLSALPRIVGLASLDAWPRWMRESSAWLGPM